MSLLKQNYSYSIFLSSMDYGKTTGSGLRIESEGNEFLITARHVLIDENGELRCESFLVTSQNSIGEPEDARIIEIDLNKSTMHHQDSIDIICVKLEKDNNYSCQQEGANINSVPLEDVVGLESIEIAASAIQVGFPTSLYMDGSNFFDVNRPLLRKGIVAGIHSKENTFIIDCPAFYGNSGGPIIQTNSDNETKLIGIVSRYIPFVTEWKNRHERQFVREEFYNSGYAVCVPFDSIFEFIGK